MLKHFVFMDLTFTREIYADLKSLRTLKMHIFMTQIGFMEYEIYFHMMKCEEIDCNYG